MLVERLKNNNEKNFLDIILLFDPTIYPTLQVEHFLIILVAKIAWRMLNVSERLMLMFPDKRA